MKTLLELRDIEQDLPESERGKMFIAMDFSNGPNIYNGRFLDPFLNTITVKGIEGKCFHLKDVEMAKIQADWVE